MNRTPMEIINQRRRQIHVHSIIYYHMHTSIITDKQFDDWCKELVTLHADNPELVGKGYMHEVFSDFTGDTGMHLPITPEVVATGRWLIENQHKYI